MPGRTHCVDAPRVCGTRADRHARRVIDGESDSISQVESSGRAGVWCASEISARTASGAAVMTHEELVRRVAFNQYAITILVALAILSVAMQIFLMVLSIRVQR